MLPGLPVEIAVEVDALATRYGRPLLRVVESAYWRPRAARRGRHRLCEVCMVVRRPNGRLLTGSKTFYPRGIYRLLTGGVERGERVLDALRRETHEETGLDTEVRRFLAAIAYCPPASPDEPDRPDQPAAARTGGGHRRRPVFYTFAFLLDEVGGTLGAVDEAEQLAAYREVTPGDLRHLANRLEHLGERRRAGGGRDGGNHRSDNGHWREWGRFRAICHRVVRDALSSLYAARAAAPGPPGSPVYAAQAAPAGPRRQPGPAGPPGPPGPLESTRPPAPSP